MREHRIKDKDKILVELDYADDLMALNERIRKMNDFLKF